MVTSSELCLKFLELAKKELGVHEIRKCDTARILEYHKATELKAGKDEVPWCSSFANFIVQQVGLKGTRSAAARSWLRWGKKITKPIPGCIVVLDRKDANNPNAAHVTFFHYAEKAHGVICCIGGNQGDRVKESRYDVEKVLGYRMPK